MPAISWSCWVNRVHITAVLTGCCMHALSAISWSCLMNRVHITAVLTGCCMRDMPGISWSCWMNRVHITAVLTGCCMRAMPGVSWSCWPDVYCTHRLLHTSPAHITRRQVLTGCCLLALLAEWLCSPDRIVHCPLTGTFACNFPCWTCWADRSNECSEDRCSSCFCNRSCDASSTSCS